MNKFSLILFNTAKFHFPFPTTICSTDNIIEVTNQNNHIDRWADFVCSS